MPASLRNISNVLMSPRSSLTLASEYPFLPRVEMKLHNDSTHSCFHGMMVSVFRCGHETFAAGLEANRVSRLRVWGVLPQDNKERCVIVGVASMKFLVHSIRSANLNSRCVSDGYLGRRGEPGKISTKSFVI